ncbi:MAG: TetR/AcrR family transcriptional regulator [Gammaproteobacteria bacterium]
MPQNSAKSSQTQSSIIDAAGRILIDEGYNGFTLRKVANAANISIGNLNYHYPTKTALIDAVVDVFTDRIIDGFNDVAERAGESPEKRFRAVLEYWIDDLKTEGTSVFFPEIWALSNHYDFAREAAKRSYNHAREILAGFIRDLNPRLSADEVDIHAKYFCASLEGLTVFIGHKKMWAADHGAIKSAAIENFIQLIGTN